MTARKIFWTLLAVISAAAALTGVVDTTSGELADKALKRALVTFAVARTLNGVISVAQGTEVAVEPAGIGVILGVGQILDPINDLIERFSSVMLVAASSIGLQLLLLNISAAWGLTVLLVAASVGAVVALWSPGVARSRWGPMLLRAFLVMFFLRFAVPLLVIGSNFVFDTFLAGEQAEATQALEATRSEIEELEEEARVEPPEDQGWRDRLSSMLDESLQSMNVSERMERLQGAASNASEHIVTLIAIFVLETVLLPLVFLWLLVEALKSIAIRTMQYRPGNPPEP
jgi:hypothetical protein